MAPAFLSIDDVLQLTGLKRSTFYNWRDRGLFPQPVRVGSRDVTYPRDTIVAWVAQHSGHRDPIRRDPGLRAMVG